jgi:hypothetical protein
MKQTQVESILSARQGGPIAMSDGTVYYGAVPEFVPTIVKTHAKGKPTREVLRSQEEMDEAKANGYTIQWFKAKKGVPFVKIRDRGGIAHA